MQKEAFQEEVNRKLVEEEKAGQAVIEVLEGHLEADSQLEVKLWEHNLMLRNP